MSGYTFTIQRTKRGLKLINGFFLALSSDFCLLTLVGSQCFIWHSCNNAVARYFVGKQKGFNTTPYMYVRRTTLCKLFLKAFVHYIFAAFTSHPISPNYFFFFLFQADAINAGIGGKKLCFQVVQCLLKEVLVQCEFFLCTLSKGNSNQEIFLKYEL